MPDLEWTVRRVENIDDALITGLADVLLDCVDGDASVSFMHPLTRERARSFGVARRLLRHRLLLPQARLTT